jgi:hypothetical protein
MNHEARIRRLEQKFGHGGFYDRDIITFHVRKGGDEEAEKRKAVQEFEAEHGRELGTDTLLICFKCVS